MANKEERKPQGYIIHSLVGSTSGNNNTQTLTNILNSTTVKPTSQSVNATNTNQTQKGRE